MSIRSIIASVTLFFLVACGSGGGGGSSTIPVVYSPVGTFSGHVTGTAGGPGVLTLQINNDASGDFYVSYLGDSPTNLTFASSIGHISGSVFSISSATVSSIGPACIFSLRATMINFNQMNGSYSLNCLNGNGTITFLLTRTA